MRVLSCLYLEGGAPALHELPLVEVSHAWHCGVSEAPRHIHCLMVAIQDVQSAARPLRLPLQPLQPVQDLNFIVASVQLITHL